ncbi:MFS transporter [Noviherbaspirillum denitrificans]|uniref:Multidrug efflux pump Tap n=1 Tax=Noviherbaspirillum denitrificans TaxID=1968433 RepID=A0A254TGQ4_9BURK|nr:MFS transporter [Noviherbaspirillum denitrificans]OWW21347.1 MFS transporter [Noviherbaspirillum denitrificans]
MSSPLADYPAFRNFFLSRVATTMANQMMMVVVAWQMYDLTNNAYDLGMVGLAQFLPALALVLVTGQAADRYDRRRVLAACLAGQLLVSALLLAGTFGGWLNRDFILLASVALGTAKAFQMPTQQALGPLLVPPFELPRALALSSAGTQFAIIIGPAAGGFLYVGGAKVVYGVTAILFLLAIVAVLLIHLERAPAPREPVSLQTLFAGIGFIWRRKEVLGAISLDLFAVLLGGATALLPIFARDILHVGPWGLGVLRSAPAAGALLVSLYLARHPIHRKAGKVMFGAVALYGVATLVFALSASFWVSLAALALTGAFDMVSVVIRQSLVQLDTPDEMRGRVSAVNSIFIGASNQLGEFESGLTAAWFGAVTAVLIGGAGTLLIVAAWMKLFPSLVAREQLAAGQ